jgi:hypothetical protein
MNSGSNLEGKMGRPAAQILQTEAAANKMEIEVENEAAGRVHESFEEEKQVQGLNSQNSIMGSDIEGLPSSPSSLVSHKMKQADSLDVEAMCIPDIAQHEHKVINFSIIMQVAQHSLISTLSVKSSTLCLLHDYSVMKSHHITQIFFLDCQIVCLLTNLAWICTGLATSSIFQIMGVEDNMTNC